MRPTPAGTDDARKGSISLRPRRCSKAIGLGLFGLLTAVASARSQSLPVSNPHDIMASDQAAFIQFLDEARPAAVTPGAKAMVLKSLPPEGEIRIVSASARDKITALYPVLRATQRAGVYEVKVIDVPQAAIAIHGRAVILITQPALEMLETDQLRALVAHEAAHEYVWKSWEDATKRDDWKQLQQLELVCDAIAVVILHQLGLEVSSLIRGIERITQWNLLRFGRPLNERKHPTLAERREFARDVAAWVTGPSRSVTFSQTATPSATDTCGQVAESSREMPAGSASRDSAASRGRDRRACCTRRRPCP